MGERGFQRRTLKHTIEYTNRPSAFSRNDRFETNPSENEDHPMCDSNIPTVQQSSVNAASLASTSCLPTSALRDASSPLGVDCPNPAIIRSINADICCPNPAVIRSINVSAEISLGTRQRREPMGSEYPSISQSSQSSYASMNERTKSYNNPSRKQIFRNIDPEGMPNPHFPAIKFGESSPTTSTIGAAGFRKNYDLKKHPIEEDSVDDDYKDELSYEVEKILGKSVSPRKHPATCKSMKESSNNILSDDSVAFKENRHSLQGQYINRNSFVGTLLSKNERAEKKGLSDTEVNTFLPISKTPSHIRDNPDLLENMQLRTSPSHDKEDSNNSLTQKLFTELDAFKNTLAMASEYRQFGPFVEPPVFIEDPQQGIEPDDDVLYSPEISPNIADPEILNLDHLQNAPLAVSKDVISSGHPPISLGPPALFVNELFRNGENILISIKRNVPDSEEPLQPSANTLSYLHFQPVRTSNFHDIKDVATQTSLSYLTEQLPGSHEISTSSQAGNSHLDKICDEMPLHNNSSRSNPSLHSPFNSNLNNDQIVSARKSYMLGTSSINHEDTKIRHENLTNVGNDSTALRKQFAKNESKQRNEMGRNLDRTNLTGVKSKICPLSETTLNLYPHNLDNRIIVPEESSDISGSGSSNQVELGENVDGATCSESPRYDLVNASPGIRDEKRTMNYPMAKRIHSYIKINGITYCRIEKSDHLPDSSIKEYYTDSYDASGKNYGSDGFVPQDTYASIPVSSSSKLETILEDCSNDKTESQREPMGSIIFSDIWKQVQEDVWKYQKYPMSEAIRRLRRLLDEHFEKCHKYLHIRVSDLQSMKEKLLRQIKEEQLGIEDCSEQASAIISMLDSGPLIDRGTSFSASGTVHQSNAVQTSSDLGAASNAHKKTTATRINRNNDYDLPSSSSIRKLCDKNSETGKQMPASVQFDVQNNEHLMEAATHVKERVNTSENVGRTSKEQYDSCFSSHISHHDQNSQVPFPASWCIPVDDRIDKKVSLQVAFSQCRANLIENIEIRKRMLSVLEQTRRSAAEPPEIKSSEMDKAIRRPKETALHNIPNHTTTFCPTCGCGASRPTRKINHPSCPKHDSSVTTKPVCSSTQTARKFNHDFGPVPPKTREAYFKRLSQLTKQRRIKARKPKNVYLEKKARDNMYAKYREQAKLFSQTLKDYALAGHVTWKLHETVNYMK